MNTFAIREANAGDSEGISEVFRVTWLATYPNTDVGITENDIRDIDFRSPTAVAKRKKSIANADVSKHFWVACEGKGVVGVCVVGREDSSGWIRALYVLPEYQSRGIGTALLKKALIWFDVAEIFVNVAVYNKEAIDFYRKQGFTETGQNAHSKAAVLPSGKVIPEINMSLRLVATRFHGK